jgi:hypothetical protein
MAGYYDNIRSDHSSLSPHNHVHFTSFNQAQPHPSQYHRSTHTSALPHSTASAMTSMNGDMHGHHGHHGHSGHSGNRQYSHPVEYEQHRAYHAAHQPAGHYPPHATATHAPETQHMARLSSAPHQQSSRFFSVASFTVDQSPYRGPVGVSQSYDGSYSPASTQATRWDGGRHHSQAYSQQSETRQTVAPPTYGSHQRDYAAYPPPHQATLPPRHDNPYGPPPPPPPPAAASAPVHSSTGHGFAGRGRQRAHTSTRGGHHSGRQNSRGGRTHVRREQGNSNRKKHKGLEEEEKDEKPTKEAVDKAQMDDGTIYENEEVALSHTLFPYIIMSVF